jgi:hypothetical protein
LVGKFRDSKYRPTGEREAKKNESEGTEEARGSELDFVATTGCGEGD